MKFHNPNARLFVPDQAPEPLARITHLGIGAHQDDLEFMAFHGILACCHSREKWFGGVTCTDGAGSSRSGDYAGFTDEEMQRVRIQEQEAAAVVGNYGAMIQLGYPSSAAKSSSDPSLKNDLLQILSASRPEAVYTHNPADKHDTHIGVFAATIQALREMPRAERPKAVYGCEVWRDLDWMPDKEKVVHNVSAHENLAAALNGVFDSQIAGGKRYDLATLGRRRANATFFESHAVDDCERISFAMDLTPLVADPSLDIVEYVLGFIRRFEADVRNKLAQRLG
ncbi:MAG: PIG-L family deacetylase [Terrimicrobiaceae bacterium]|nr:PIG-L family deacetylase [Terrimicrobiaceae bacterium]